MNLACANFRADLQKRAATIGSADRAKHFKCIILNFILSVCASAANWAMNKVIAQTLAWFEKQLQVLTCSHHLAGLVVSHNVWFVRHAARATGATRDPDRRVFSCGCSPPSHFPPYAFANKNKKIHPNYTQRAHRRTSANFALHSPPLSLLPTLNLPNSNGSILESRSGLWCIFSMIRSFQIKGLFVLKLTENLRRPVIKSKHAEVPFQIHLRNGRAFPYVHATINFLFWPLLQQLLQTVFTIININIPFQSKD